MKVLKSLVLVVISTVVVLKFLAEMKFAEFMGRNNDL